MLDISILGELTVDACAAVTGQQDAAALLRGIDVANLFLSPSTISGPASGITTWCASCCGPSFAPATGPGSRSSSCGRLNGSSPPGIPG